MSGQQMQHGNDNGREQMEWSNREQEETSADAVHPDRQTAGDPHTTGGSARLPIQISDPLQNFDTSKNTGKDMRKLARLLDRRLEAQA